jgi:hypothetical protein
MKYLIIIITIFHSTVFTAQNKIIYLDDDLNEITAEVYNKSNDNNYFLEIVDHNTLFKIKVERFKAGKLSKTEHLNLKKELSELSGRTISDKSKIIINYYHGKDECNSSGNSKLAGKRFVSFSEKVNNKRNTVQLFMYKSSEDVSKYGQKINWIEDKNRKVTELFFPLDYPCGSAVIIYKNGRYRSFRGEYDLNRILEKI